MPINEVFPNPTVKQVFFQIRFPNLFFLESRIGDLQQQVMQEFPEATLLRQQHVVFADIAVEPPESPRLPPDVDGPTSRKIWQFNSPKGYKLSVTTDSLAITSEHHKTYDKDDANRFRDVIQRVLTAFAGVAPVPEYARVGLRYVDHCPIMEKTNESFEAYYSTSFPLTRFSLADAEEMSFAAIVTRGRHQLRYVEALRKDSDADSGFVLVLDFDGFAKDVPSGECLTVTDELHTLIDEAFSETIKQPVYDYMRREGG
ncbi:TIGR04255 family protein [bacterium]|nr:TIGR04255 family protein [bacterium]